MNISPVSYTSANYNNNNVRKMNQNVSFCGGKTAFTKKSGGKIAERAGCAGNILLLIALSPLTLMEILLQNTKKNKIKSMCIDMQDGYKSHIPYFEFFDIYVKKMNTLLDKHSKNAEYSQFTKDALEFLRTRFENNQGCNDEWKRLKPFKKESDKYGMLWAQFWYAVEESAKMAISKNGKGIDKEKLDKYIQVSREIMQQAE